MKTILIINKQQFGYLTDVVKWAETIRHSYKVKVICFDVGYKRINVDGVDVTYVPYSRFFVLNAILFYLFCVINIMRTDGVIVEYFSGCSLLKKIFRKRIMLLDVRTLSVSEDSLSRSSYNRKLLETCRLYDHITVISQGVYDDLKSINIPIDILPLGADQISEVPKSFDRISLLYVGTLSGRDIHKTIYGFSEFCQKHPSNDVMYHIVGEGNTLKERELLNKLINELNLSDKIILYGRVPYDELKPFFDKSNVGVSFVPMTAYYDNQPATKTYEYAMSGLFTIATSTRENKKVINQENGILIDDTPEDFCKALESICAKHLDISDEAIRNSVSDYKWPILIQNHLLPIINSIY